jgi:hypothetical protein
MAQFIRIQHRMVNLDAIAYVDFLESGRAMVFMRGLTQEKQNIPVEPQDARSLRALLDAECLPDARLPDTRLPDIRPDKSPLAPSPVSRRF